MKTNKILAVALSAGLVLGGASYAHAGSSGGSVEQPAEKTLYDLDQDVQKAEKELNDAKAKLDEENAKEEKDEEAIKEAKKAVETAEARVKAAKEAFNKKDAERKEAEKKAEDEKKAEEERVAGRAKALEEAKAELKAAGLENEKKLKELEEGETAYDVDQIKEKLLKEFKEKHLTLDEYNEKNKTLTIDEWLKQQEEDKKPEDKKPEDKKPEVEPTPAPETSDNHIVGGGSVVVPEVKEEEKPVEKEAEKPVEKEIEKEKEEKAKPAKKAVKPAKKGNNPKTGIIGLAPIYSTLAISMAGIVAARKKND